ncbi:MAG: HAD family hydrolase [Thermoplasmata archaeon]
MRVRAVLFDLGGTLIDHKDFDGWAEVARRFFLDFDADQLRHAFLEVEEELDARPPGVHGEAAMVEFWRRTLSRAAEREVDEATTLKFNAAVFETERPVRLYSDTRRCLDTLRAQRRALGVVSNSTSEAAVRRILDRVGILDYFSRIVSSGTEGVEKPDPEIFRRTLSRMNVPAAQTVYVGNLAHTDAKAASAVGMYGVWLNREGFGFGWDPPEITSLLEVPLVVRRLENGEASMGGAAAGGAR